MLGPRGAHTPALGTVRDKTLCALIADTLDARTAIALWTMGDSMVLLGSVPGYCAFHRGFPGCLCTLGTALVQPCSCFQGCGYGFKVSFVNILTRSLSLMQPARHTAGYNTTTIQIQYRSSRAHIGMTMQTVSQLLATHARADKSQRV